VGPFLKSCGVGAVKRDLVRGGGLGLDCFEEIWVVVVGQKICEGFHWWLIGSRKKKIWEREGKIKLLEVRYTQS
jgi:hypothetical protein